MMDNNQFREYGHKFVDWVADYFEGVGDLPVKPDVNPGEIRARLPEAPPFAGEAMSQIFQDFQSTILPGVTHWQHPGWFAYFPANNSPESVLAEFLTAGLGAQCMIWQTSPAAAELEEVVMGWLRQMLGLPEGMDGVIQDSASTATLCALLTAREKATNFLSNLKGTRQPLVVYCSAETHSSVEKAAKIAGFGKENVRLVPTDDNFALQTALLEQMIITDRKNGLEPTCVVATIGTTSSTAVDPVQEIGEICQRQGLWLHVDAAYAGAAALLEEKRHLFAGLELVDSFVFNPHKWLLTNFDCSAYFVKDAALLKRTFEIHPEYLKTNVDQQVNNYRDWGVQLGRRFRALKLWFVIRSYGVDGLQAFVREHIRLANLFKEWVEADPSFEVLAPVHFSLVCFRFNDGRSEADLDELNKRLLDKVNSSGRVYMTHTSLKGKFAIRLVVGQRTTDESHVQEAWNIIRSAANNGEEV